MRTLASLVCVLSVGSTVATRTLAQPSPPCPEGVPTSPPNPAVGAPTPAVVENPLDLLRARVHRLDRRRRAGTVLWVLGSAGWVAGTVGSVATYSPPDCYSDYGYSGDGYGDSFCGVLDFGPGAGVVATSILTVPLVLTGAVLVGRARRERARLVSLAPALALAPPSVAREWSVGVRGRV